MYQTSIAEYRQSVRNGLAFYTFRREELSGVWRIHRLAVTQPSPSGRFGSIASIAGDAWPGSPLARDELRVCDINGAAWLARQAKEAHEDELLNLLTFGTITIIHDEYSYPDRIRIDMFEWKLTAALAASGLTEENR